MIFIYKSDQFTKLKIDHYLYFSRKILSRIDRPLTVQVVLFVEEMDHSLNISLTL